MLDIGTENWFKFKKQLKGRERVPSRYGLATQEQEAVPGTQQPSENLVSGTDCKGDVTTEQSKTPEKLHSGPGVQKQIQVAYF